jgi:hypothetical protein
VIDKGDNNKPVTNDIPANPGDKFEIFKNGTARVAGPFGPESSSPTPNTSPNTAPTSNTISNTTPTTPPDSPVPPKPLEEIVAAVFETPPGTRIINSPNLPKPTTIGDFQNLAQEVINSGGGGIIFHPDMELSWPGTCEILLKDIGDTGFYINFNGARLRSLATDGQTTAMRFRTSGGGNIRHVTIENFTLYGNGYDTPGCGNGIEFIADGGAALLCTLREVRASWCGKNGFFGKGDFFESSFYGLNCKDNRENGAVFDNNPGVVSNIMMYGTNLSRNRKHGLVTLSGAQSIDLFGGSFVNNDIGGVKGPIRSAYGVNGENTGEVLFDLGWLPYPCRIVGCNLSSNGTWRNQSNPLSKVSQYLIRYDKTRGNIIELANETSYTVPYGAPVNMAVIAP